MFFGAASIARMVAAIDRIKSGKNLIFNCRRESDFLGFRIDGVKRKESIICKPALELVCAKECKIVERRGQASALGCSIWHLVGKLYILSTRVRGVTVYIFRQQPKNRPQILSGTKSEHIVRSCIS